MLLGLATPGRVGEYSKLIYLKKDQHSLGKGVSGMLIDKLFDLSFILIFGIIAIFFVPFLSLDFTNYIKTFKWFALVAPIFLVLMIVLFLYKKQKILKIFSEIIAGVKQFRPGKIFNLFLLTTTAWFVYFLSIYLVATSIGIQEKTGFLYLAFSTVIVQIAAFLPITTLGVGTREAALVFLLTPLGIPKEIIILFSLLVMANYIGLFLVCLYGWLKKPLI